MWKLLQEGGTLLLIWLHVFGLWEEMGVLTMKHRANFPRDLPGNGTQDISL